jgi:mannose-1-phosphate guanylyltransferase / mannose-6-phosphate isomerase
MNLIPTILCGGAGSRLWPVSRETHPKPFIRLGDGESLLQKAFLRGANLAGVKEILTLTNRDLFFKTQDEFLEVNSKGLPTSFILEPMARNTAAAIAAAALQMQSKYGGNAILLILAADHLISDQAAFEEAVLKAVDLALTGKLVTFGIEPDMPETGYGYIETDGTSVLRFVEKPSADKAREYIESGHFLWNSGMFCFSASSVLQQMREHCSEIIAATEACMEKSRLIAGNDDIKFELDLTAFASVPDQSIDYALMEKSDAVAVIPCNIGWSDIGSWAALGDLDAPDAQGNRLRGQTLLHNTSGCTIQGDERLIGTVGVQDLIIIDTPDAVLVAAKSCAQDVKHLYTELKLKDHIAHKLHRTVHRPWGTYTVLEEGKGFKIKRIEVKPGASLSLQMHKYRSEHWVVVSGSAVVVNGEREIVINTNESTFIPAGHKHRLTNIQSTTCVMIEVQSGSYVGEDDILRFDDMYGRTTRVA